MNNLFRKERLRDLNFSTFPNLFYLSENTYKWYRFK